MVVQLEHDGNTITNEAEIRQVFLNHLQSILGSNPPCLPFDATALYTQTNLQGLQNQISEQEVYHAIQTLAKNKACGPDGLPNEFAQSYWPAIRENIMGVIRAFFNHQIDLKNQNRANVVMI